MSKEDILYCKYFNSINIPLNCNQLQPDFSYIDLVGFNRYLTKQIENKDNELLEQEILIEKQKNVIAKYYGKCLVYEKQLKLNP